MYLFRIDCLAINLQHGNHVLSAASLQASALQPFCMSMFLFVCSLAMSGWWNFLEVRVILKWRYTILKLHLQFTSTLQVWLQYYG